MRTDSDPENYINADDMSTISCEMELLCNLLGISRGAKNIYFLNFLSFYLMLMKHFLGSHNSGLRKNGCVEKILKKIKAVSAIQNISRKG